jgi:capsule polysaccharide export protein KpsE/RkpR
LISLSIYDKNPQLATRIANYYIYYADTIINQLYSKKARENGIFLNQRISEIEMEVDSLNNLMENFQKNKNLLSIPDQVKATVEMIGVLNANLAAKEIEKNVISKALGTNSQEYKELLVEITETRKKLNEMVGTEQGKDDYMIALKNFPQLSIEYYNIFKELTLREKILEFLYPQYEQAKIEEQKQFSNILILDEAVPAERKSYPKRSIYILAIAFLVFLISSTWILVKNKFSAKHDDNGLNYLDKSYELIKQDFMKIKMKFIVKKESN